MHANVRQFVLSGWKTEKLQMELEEADFAKQYQRYTSYVLERRRWTFGSLVFPSTPSMPASISSVLLCTTFSPTVVNVFEFMQREWGLPVPRMLLSVIGSSEFQGPLPNREKTLNFLQYDILKALESYYGSFWTITGVSKISVLHFYLMHSFARRLWRHGSSYRIRANKNRLNILTDWNIFIWIIWSKKKWRCKIGEPCRDSCGQRRNLKHSIVYSFGHQSPISHFCWREPKQDWCAQNPLWEWRWFVLTNICFLGDEWSFRRSLQWVYGVMCYKFA